jgi:hypothetical protein
MYKQLLCNDKNMYNKLNNIYMIDKVKVYDVLRIICQQYTNQHLSFDIFSIIWNNIDCVTWELNDECYIQYAHDYDIIMSNKGAYKYKKNKKSTVRLNKSYRIVKDDMLYLDYTSNI